MDHLTHIVHQTPSAPLLMINTGQYSLHHTPSPIKSEFVLKRETWDVSLMNVSVKLLWIDVELVFEMLCGAQIHLQNRAENKHIDRNHIFIWNLSSNCTSINVTSQRKTINSSSTLRPVITVKNHMDKKSQQHQDSDHLQHLENLVSLPVCVPSYLLIWSGSSGFSTTS